jgi:3-isopropylmalate dehydrogenase
MGMAASGNINPTRQTASMFEPVHGSAPDIAGKGFANPIAEIGSFGMALRYSLGLGNIADAVDRAIARVLDQGLRTRDIAALGEKTIGTKEMGDALLAALQKELA